MNRLVTHSIAMALLALPGLAKAQVLGHGINALERYLMSVDPRPRGVLAGSCFERDGYPGNGESWVFVIAPRSGARSYVADINSDPTDKPSQVTSNLGFLNGKRGHLEVEDNMGGLGTNERLRRLSEWIEARGLKRRSSYRNLFDRRPPVHCPDLHM
jgi:hypothetical protein